MSSSHPQNPNQSSDFEYWDQLFRSILDLADSDAGLYPLRRAMRMLDLNQLQSLYDDVVDFVGPGDLSRVRQLLDERFPRPKK
jgi:hypothetical protein